MKIYKKRNVKTPVRGTTKSAGMDIFIPESEDFKYVMMGGEHPAPSSGLRLHPGESALIPTGLIINVPKDCALIVFNKSGVAAKKDLIIGACVIDEDYEGETHVDIKNIGSRVQTISAGDKITQLLCVPIKYPEIEIEENLENLFTETSERGSGGFGSTGTK